MEKHVIILAAGKGTRMKSNKPKVMHEVASKTMVEFVLDLSKDFGASSILSVIGEGMDDLAGIASGYGDSIIQMDRNGTGGAVSICKDKMAGKDGVIFILYGDTPFIAKNTLDEMYNELSTKDICVLGFEAGNPHGYGRLVTEGGTLTSIVEQKDTNNDEKAITLCNSGVIAAKADVLWDMLGKIDNKNASGEYYLTDVIGLGNDSGLQVGYVTAGEDEVMGVNSKQDLARAEGIYQDILRDKHMSAGVQLIDPASTYFSAGTQIGRDSIIEPNVHFYGKVEIADNVRIRANSYLEDCKVAEGCVIGPFARLRPKAEIGAGSKVGNFVEIKNSTLHEGVKAGHLAYIGDSEIGEGTNIGAGAITCNYDGVNKHKTNVGKNVFIGSNTEIIAPINIGDSAVIGAGTTVLKDVEAGKTAINKKSQEEL